MKRIAIVGDRQNHSDPSYCPMASRFNDSIAPKGGLRSCAHGLRQSIGIYGTRPPPSARGQAHVRNSVNELSAHGKPKTAAKRRHASPIVTLWQPPLPLTSKRENTRTRVHRQDISSTANFRALAVSPPASPSRRPRSRRSGYRVPFAHRRLPVPRRCLVRPWRLP